MRIVSDFLDRVAIRAIGGEAMLSPRLPSLYEPARPSSPEQQEQAMDGSSRGVKSIDQAVHGRGMAPVPFGSGVLPIPPALASQVGVTSPAPALAHRPSASQPAPARSPAEAGSARLRVEPAPSGEVPMTQGVAKPTVLWMGDHHGASGMFHGETSVGRDPGDQASASAQALSALREPQGLASPGDEPAGEGETGVLLPPARPVFATPPSMSGPRAPASRQSRMTDGQASPQEPVVHVSIGRLEVRAAAPGAAPPRRQEAARPNSLDEYLRQRSGKPA